MSNCLLERRLCPGRNLSLTPAPSTLHGARHHYAGYVDVPSALQVGSQEEDFKPRSQDLSIHVLTIPGLFVHWSPVQGISTTRGAFSSPLPTAALKPSAHMPCPQPAAPMFCTPPCPAQIPPPPGSLPPMSFQHRTCVARKTPCGWCVFLPQASE